MAMRYYTPVMFGLEKNIVHLYAQVTFDGAGIPTLNALNSKGICAVHQQSVMLTGGVVNSTTSIGTVSSFAGLYRGMTVSGTGMAGTNTIASMSASGDTITMAKQNIITGDGITLTASGGRYLFQFGSQEAMKLDTYNKLLGVQVSYDMTLASASGSLTALALAPQAPGYFVVSNLTNTVTIPKVSTSGSTDASLSLQFGSGAGNDFVAFNPVAGTTMRIQFSFCNSTAI